MGNKGRAFAEAALKSKVKPTDNEMLALAINARLLKVADESNELRSILKNFTEQLKLVADQVGKAQLDNLVKRLDSPKAAVRLKALEEFYDRLQRTFKVRGSQSLKDLIDRAVREIGTDALRAIPEFETAYRRYLSRKRIRNPDFTASFAEFLKDSRSKKLPFMLKALLATDVFKSLMRARRIYKPADGNIQLAQKTVDAIKSSLSDAFSKIPANVVVDMVVKKLGPIKDFEMQSGQLFWLLKKKLLVKVVEVDRLIEFPRGYLQNLQGNLGELIAMAFKAKRFEELFRKTEGDAIFLFQDVRAKGKRIVPDKADPDFDARFKADKDMPDVVPDDISEKDLRDLEMSGMSQKQRRDDPAGVPMKEEDIPPVEFSDDFLVNLADPKRPKFVEQFESKVTRDSLGDGAKQIAKNIEVMSQTTEITVGRVMKLDKNGKWAEVPLSQVPGAQIITGKDGVQRLIFKENEEWLEKADDIMEELANKIGKVRESLPPGPKRDKAIADLVKGHHGRLPKRSLQDLVQSKKYLTIPHDQLKTGVTPDNVKAIPLELGNQKLTYNEIVGFCNVLMLRSFWHNLFD